MLGQQLNVLKLEVLPSIHAHFVLLQFSLVQENLDVVLRLTFDLQT